MNFIFASHPLWSCAIDLSFDCHYVTCWRKRHQDNPVMAALRENADRLLVCVRGLFRNPLRLGRARHFLRELKQGLKLALGLGFLSKRVAGHLRRRLAVVAAHIRRWSELDGGVS